MSDTNELTASSSEAATNSAEREVRYVHSTNLVPLFTQLGASLLVSTYQAGKLVVVGAEQGKLVLSFHNFDRPMGMATKPGWIAVGAREQIWFLRDAPDIAPRLEPIGKHDGCFLARCAQVTGEIQVHEMSWSGEELWIVNTLFSCLCTLQRDYSFVPRWRPLFISKLAAEDRCHLNGMVLVDGHPKYVTALAKTDTPGGWRPDKVTGGCIMDVASGETVAQGFCMPHSPRVFQNRLWLLNSGEGRLVVVEPGTGQVDTVAQLPGYTRGLAFHGEYGFIGLSKIRETSTFGGVPIADDRDKLKCGVAVVHLPTGEPVAWLEFQSGVDEIFDVQLLPGIRWPAVSGPFATQEGEQTIWIVPEPS